MEENFIPQETVVENEENTNCSGIRKPGLLHVSLLYSLCVILLIFIGSRVQHAEFYSGILITEFVLIMLPALLMLFVFRYDARKVLRINRIGIINILLIIGIMACALPLVGLLNAVNLLLIKSIFGKVIVNQPPTADTAIGLLISVLVIGGSAGICEEVLFRGTIQRGFERFGAVRAILVTSLLFGLMHIDFQKLLGTFLLGALIGFIVYRSDSIFGGIIAHATNNSIAVVLAYAGQKLSNMFNPGGNNGQTASGELDLSMFYSLPKDQQTIVIIIWIIMGLVIAAVFGTLFTLCIIAFKRRTSKARADLRDTSEESPKWTLVGLFPGIAIVSFIYVAQGLKLKGITSPVIDSILGVLGLK